ncbi:MAG: methyltransferase [Acidimicrobiia bacterium]|nr:methyltransferase [Acidimicrobiia bacterium]
MTERFADLDRIADWGEFDLPANSVERLEAFERWLGDEAVEAGGIGPKESERLWERHILDSAIFAGFVVGGDEVLDVGSGVGLPGLVVAVLRPDAELTLLDRSGRRCDLSRRAIRVLGLTNVRVVQGDLNGYIGEHSVAISRASLPPSQLLEPLRGVSGLREIVAAGSRSTRPPPTDGWETVEIPGKVLGRPLWLMRASLSSNSAG